MVPILLGSTTSVLKPQSFQASREADIPKSEKRSYRFTAFGSTTVSGSPSAYTGSNPTTDQLYIDHDYDELGQLSSTGTGMSLLKLRAARRILEMRNVDYDQPWFLAMTPNQEQDLLADPNLTTQDRMNLKAYQNGEMPSFYGFNFIKTTALVNGSHGFRECYAYTKNAMGMAVGREMFSKMDERADKNHSLQIATYFAANASRLDETEMVQIRCEETPATS